jgi:choline kinase
MTGKSVLDRTFWGLEDSKIAILVPTRDSMYSHFSYCLNQLIKVSTQLGLDVYVFYDSSTVLLNQRNNLIKMALELDAKYSLWLDSDMVFPSSTLTRLLSHKKDIIGCNYMRRSLPLKTVTYTDIRNWNSWVPLETDEDIIEVDGTGMGCLLMKTEIFTKLQKPYFSFTYQPISDDHLGEDFTLLQNLKKLNYKVYIDTVLSKEVRHLGTFGFGYTP